MEKYLCWGSMGIAGVFLVLFVLDLVLQFPFNRLNTAVDVLGALTCGIVGYLGWEAYRDLR